MTEPSESTSLQPAPALSRNDLPPILGIILLALILYQPLLVGRPVMPDTWERFEPWNSELGFDGPLDPRITNSNNDAILLYIPWNKLAHDELRAGRVPAWDPYCLCGVPLASNHLVPVFYPIYALIAWALPPLFVMGASGLVHTLILAIFFYLFLKEWIGNRTAGWLAASCLVVSLLPNPHYQPWPMTLAWFPAIWFFHERWLKHRSPWAGLWMALCWSGPLLSGYPSLFIQMSLFTAAWFLARPNMMEAERRPSWASRVGILLLPFVLAVGLSAVQNIPTVMASMESDRTIFKTSEELAREAAFTLPSNQPWQMHVKRLLQPALPFRFPGNDLFNRGYVGVFPVVFALLGLGWLKRKEYPRLVLLLALIVAPFALIPAANFAVYWITRGILIDPNPPVEVLGFLVLMLSAVGIKAWLDKMEAGTSEREGSRLNWGVIAGIVGAALILAAAIRVDPRSFVPGLSPIVIAAVSLIVAASAISPVGHRAFRNAGLVLIGLTLATAAFLLGSDYLAPTQGTREFGFEPMPEVDEIRALRSLQDPEQGREWGRIIRFSCEPVNVMSLTEQPYTFYPNLGTYFGIWDAFGYHNLAPGRQLDSFRRIEESAVIERRGIVALTDPDSLERIRGSAFGARYVVSDCEIPDLELRYAGRSFFVYDLGPWTDARTEAVSCYVVTEMDTGEITPLELREPMILEDSLERIAVRSEQSVDTVLILAEGYACGWRATIDGEAAEVHRYEDMRMAVEVRAGNHLVEFRYVMPGLKSGWILTSLSGVLWLLIGAFVVFRRRGRE